jgi:SHS2 domain-containing protein
MVTPPAGWRPIEHTADEAFEAWGPTVEDVFAEAARALFAVIAGEVTPDPGDEAVVLELEAEDRRALLHEWLETLNARHQGEEVLFHSFAPNLAGNRLTGACRAQPIDPARHDLRTEVKAVTWHDLTLTCEDGVWRATVLLDI